LFFFVFSSVFKARFLVCSVYLGFLFALGGNLSLHLFFEDGR
jgi:hypothetical protein